MVTGHPQNQFVSLSLTSLFLEYKTWEPNTNKTGSTILKEWTTPDFRNTPSTTNLEEEEIVDAPENDGNESMSDQEDNDDDLQRLV